jgi:thiamine pyrophosphate-dependent acetolactate synthase large subunit-like protein
MSATVGTLLVDLLAANDVDTVFGIPGVHTLDLYRGIAASRLRHVLVRHEQNAGFAADGFARSSGRIAAAFVISGPGLTNILTAVGQAYSDSVPLLVIASTPVRTAAGKQWGVLHELRDQSAVAAGLFGVARSASSAEDVRDHLRACLAALRTGRRRPAYLEIPLDVLGAPTTLAAERFAAPPPLPVPPPEQVAAAARVLAAAQRPLVIAGGGATGAAAELAQLVDTLDALLVTTTAGKGVLPERHGASLGASLPYPETRALAVAADVIVAVGTEMAETDLFTSLRLPLHGQLIRIDVDEAKLADQYGAQWPIWGDARGALGSLNSALASLHGASASRNGALVPRSGWNTAIGGAQRVRAQIDRSFGPDARAQLAVLHAIRAALPADGAVFSDMTQIAYLGNYAFAADRPGQWFHPSGYGTLGFALPAALGAKIAAPARAIVALAGDFGVQFTLQELMTAVEQGHSLPIIVWNNTALGQIRDDMVAAGIAPIGVVGRNPDFVALAHACGAAAVRLHGAEGVAAAVRAALERPGPTLIEIVA